MQAIKKLSLAFSSKSQEHQLKRVCALLAGSVFLGAVSSASALSANVNPVAAPLVHNTSSYHPVFARNNTSSVTSGSSSSAAQSGSVLNTRNVVLPTVTHSLGLPLNQVQLNLSSTRPNVMLGSNLFQNVQSVSVNVGGRLATFHAGSHVTSAEFVAIQQVLNNGVQALKINPTGSASGGNFIVNSGAAASISSLVVPKSVTAFDIVSGGQSLSLSGNLLNFGTIDVLSTNSQFNSGSISAMNITNEHGAVITSRLTSPLQAAFPGAISGVSLNLNASQNISNAGSVISSGALSLNAGGSISNITVSNSTPALIQSVNNLTISAGSGKFVNSGLIKSSSGNINLTTPNASTNININGNGGTFQALAGDISVRNNSYQGAANATLSGGNYLSNNLNIYSGSGDVEGSVGNVSGNLNTAAQIEHFFASTPNLNIGQNTVDGDPTFVNTAGNITINGLNTFNGDVAILASGNITAGNATAEIVANDGANNGLNIIMIAGATITTTGSSTAVVPGTALTGAQIATVTLGTGAGGNINLNANTGAVVLESGAVSASGTGGNITLVAVNNAGTGGQVILPAAAAVDTSAVNGNAGSISIFASATAGTAISSGILQSTSGGGTPGNVSLTAARAASSDGNTLVFNSSGDITSGNTIIAGAAAASGVLTNSAISGGTINISAGSAINVGAAINGNAINLSTSGAAANIALGGNINVTGAASVIAAGTGTISQPNASTLHAGSVILSSGSGAIGSLANPILLQTPSLTATTTGNVFASDSQTSSINLNSSSASAAASQFVFSAPNLNAGQNVVGTITSPTVVLSTVNGDFGTALNNIQTNATTLTASTGTTSGNVFINTTGAVTLSNANGAAQTFQVTANGNLTLSGPLSATNVSLLANPISNGAIILDNNIFGPGNSSANSVTLTPSGTGTITAPAGNTITTGILNMGSPSVTGAIGTNVANIITNATTISANTSGNVFIKDTSPSNITLNQSSGAIFQLIASDTTSSNPRITVTQPLGATTITLGGTNAAGNNISVFVNANIGGLGGGNATTVNLLASGSGSIIQIAPSTISTTNLVLSSVSGPIGQSGVGPGAGPITTNATNFSANTSNDVSIVDTNTVGATLNAASSGGTFTLTGSGAGAPLTVSAPLTATTFATIQTTGGGNVSVTAPLFLGNNGAATGGGLVQTVNGGNATVSGAVTASGSGISEFVVKTLAGGNALLSGNTTVTVASLGTALVGVVGSNGGSATLSGVTTLNGAGNQYLVSVNAVAGGAATISNTVNISGASSGNEQVSLSSTNSTATLSGATNLTVSGSANAFVALNSASTATVSGAVNLSGSVSGTEELSVSTGSNGNIAISAPVTISVSGASATGAFDIETLSGGNIALTAPVIVSSSVVGATQTGILRTTGNGNISVASLLTAPTSISINADGIGTITQASGLITTSSLTLSSGVGAIGTAAANIVANAAAVKANTIGNVFINDIATTDVTLNASSGATFQLLDSGNGGNIVLSGVLQSTTVTLQGAAGSNAGVVINNNITGVAGGTSRAASVTLIADGNGQIADPSGATIQTTALVMTAANGSIGAGLADPAPLAPIITNASTLAANTLGNVTVSATPAAGPLTLNASTGNQIAIVTGANHNLIVAGNITGFANVSLTTSGTGAISQNANTLISSPTGSLTLSAASGSIGTAAANIQTDAPTVQANTTSNAFINDTGSTITLLSSSGSTFRAASGGDVNLAPGATLTSNNVTLLSGNNGNININGNIAAGAAGTVTLTANGNGQINQASSGSTINTGTFTLSSGTGDIGDSSAFNAAITSNAGTLSVNTAGNVAMTDTNAGLVHLNASSAGASGTTFSLNLNNAGSLTVQGNLSGDTIILTAGNGGTLNLAANVTGSTLVTLSAPGAGSITQTAGRAVSAASVDLESGTGNIGSAAVPIATNALFLTVNGLTSNAVGNVFVADSGATTLSSSSGNSFQLSTVGSLNITGALSANQIALTASNNGNINIAASGSLSGVSGADASSTSLTAVGSGSITQANGKILSLSLSLSSTSGDIGNFAGSLPISTDAGSLSANTLGNVLITDSNINGIALGNSSAGAATGSFSLTATNLSAGKTLSVNGTLSGGQLSLVTNNSGNISLANNITASNSAVFQAGTTGGTGIVNQSNGTISTPSLSLSSGVAGNLGSGNINVIATNASNLSANTAGNVAVTDSSANPLILSASQAGPTNAFTLIDSASNGSIIVNGNLQGNNIVLKGGAGTNVSITLQSGGISGTGVASMVSLQATGSGAISDNLQGSPSVSSNTLVLSSGSGNIGSAVDNITTNAGTISANTTGNVWMNDSNAGNITLKSSSAANFNLTAQGNVSTNSSNTFGGQFNLTAVSLTNPANSTLTAASININGLNGCCLTIDNAGALIATTGNINIVSQANEDLIVLGGGFMTVNNAASSINLLATGTGAATSSIEFQGNQNFFGTTIMTASDPAQFIQVDNGVLVTGNSSVTLNTSNLNLVGTGNIVGHPLIINSPNIAGTIANSIGDVNLGNTNLVFNGKDLTILAYGSVIDTGSIVIDLSSNSIVSNSNGGNLSIIAGVSFTPGTGGQIGPTGGTFSIGGATSPIGGSVMLSNATITTSSSNQNANGGNVLIVANSGSLSDGSINVGAITTSSTNAANVAGQGGNVTVIGPGSISLGTIDTRNTAVLNTSGIVNVSSAQPQIVAGVGVPPISDKNGTLNGTYTAGAISSGEILVKSINSGNAPVVLQTGLAGAVKQVAGGLISTNKLVVLAGSGGIGVTSGLGLQSLLTNAPVLTANAGLMGDVNVRDTAASVSLQGAVVNGSNFDNAAANYNLVMAPSSGSSSIVIGAGETLSGVSSVTLSAAGAAGTITEAASSSIVTPSLNLGLAGGQAVLLNAGNNVSALSSTGSGLINFRNGGNPIALGSFGFGMDLTVANAGAITTSSDSVLGAVQLSGTSAAFSNNIQASSIVLNSDNITESSGGALITPSLIINQTNGTAVLTQSANNVGDLKGTGSGSITINDGANVLNLKTFGAGQNLTVTSAAGITTGADNIVALGNVSLSAGLITISNIENAASITLSSLTIIEASNGVFVTPSLLVNVDFGSATLNNASNNISALSGTGSGAISVNNGGNDIALGSFGAGSNLTISNAGAISTSIDNTSALGTVTLSGSSINISKNESANSFVLNSANITESSGGALIASNVVLNVGSGFAQLTNSGNNVSGLSATGTGNISLNNGGNDLAIGTFASGQNLTVTNAGHISTSADNNATLGTVQLTGTTIAISNIEKASSIVLNSDNISESSGGALLTAALTVNQTSGSATLGQSGNIVGTLTGTGSGSITLNNGSNNLVLETFGAGQSVTVTNAGNVSTGADNTASALGAFSITANSVNISNNETAGAITLNTDSTTIASGVNLKGTSVAITGQTVNGSFSSGGMTLSNSGTITATTGSITVHSALGQDLTVTGSSAGNFVTLADSQGVDIVATDNGGATPRHPSILLTGVNQTFAVGNGNSPGGFVNINASGSAASQVTIANGIEYDFPNDFSIVTISAGTLNLNNGAAPFNIFPLINTHSRLIINSRGTIANSTGSIDLSSINSLNFIGDAAILAAGDIKNTGSNLTINLSSATGAGGNLVLLAGFDFSPATIGVVGPNNIDYTLTLPNAAIGKIDLGNVSINASGATTGGNVMAYANGGLINISTVATTSGIDTHGGTGAGGSVTLIGSNVNVANVSGSSINTSSGGGLAGGTVTIQSASSIVQQPTGAAIHVIGGVVVGGTFAAGTLGGNVSVGAINASQGSVTLQTNTNSGTITLGAGLPTAHGISLLAGTGILINLPATIQPQRDASGNGGSLFLSAGALANMTIDVSGSGATGSGGTASYAATSPFALNLTTTNLTINASGINAGTVDVSAGGSLTFNPAIITAVPTGTLSGTGNGAVIDLTAGTASTGNLLVTTALSANGVNHGAGGSITLKSNSPTAFILNSTTAVNGVKGLLTVNAGTTTPAGSNGAINIFNTAGGITDSAQSLLNVGSVNFSTAGATAGTITIGQSMGNSSTSSITLTAGGSGAIATGTSTLSATTINLQSTTGNIGTTSAILVKAANLTANTSINSGTGIVNLSNSLPGNLTVGASNAGGAFTIASSGGGISTAGAIKGGTTVTLKTTAANSSIQLNGNVVATNTTSGAVVLTATGSGSITDFTPAGSDFIQAKTITLATGSGNIGTGTAVNTALRINTPLASTLKTTTTGPVNVDDLGAGAVTLSAANSANTYTLRSAGALTIAAALSAATGIIIDTSAGIGGIALNAALGSPTLTQTVALSSAAGNITGAGVIAANATNTGISIVTHDGSIGTAAAALKLNAQRVSLSSTTGLVNAIDSNKGITTVTNLATGGALTFASSGATTFTTSILGSSVTLKPTGSTTFDGSITSTGAVVITEAGSGTTTFANGSSINANTSIALTTNGAFNLGIINATTAATVTQSVAGAATFNVIKGSSVTLNLKPTSISAVTFNGDITASTGSIVLTETGTAGTTTFAGTNQKLSAATTIALTTVGNTTFGSAASILSNSGATPVPGNNGGITITQGSGFLTLGSNDILTVHGNTAGSITLLEKTNAATSGIVVGTGSQLSTVVTTKGTANLPLAGQISVAIGSTVPTAPANADPSGRPSSNVTVTLTGTSNSKNNVYWGANPTKIIASGTGGTNAMKVQGNTAIVFNAGTLSTITLGGNTIFSADPPPQANGALSLAPSVMMPVASASSNHNTVGMTQPLATQHSSNFDGVTSTFVSTNNSFVSSNGSTSNNSPLLLANAAMINTGALSLNANSLSPHTKVNEQTESGSTNAIPLESVLVGPYENQTTDIDAIVYSGKEVGIVSSDKYSADLARTVLGSRTIISLRDGNVVFAPHVDTIVGTRFGNVHISAKSLVLIMASANGIAVYNFDDEHKDAVKIHASNQVIPLAPGKHVTVTRADVRDFEQVNPAEAIAYRSVSETAIGGGLKVFSSEFSLPSAMKAIKPMKALLSSNHPDAARLTGHLLKTTAVLMQMRGMSGGQYQLIPHSHMAAYAPEQ